jgi:hypothetical protein
MNKSKLIVVLYHKCAAVATSPNNDSTAYNSLKVGYVAEHSEGILCEQWTSNNTNYISEKELLRIEVMASTLLS